MRWLGRATRSRNRGNHEFDARGDFATTASWVHASLRTSVAVGSLWRLIGEVTGVWLRSLTKAADEAGQSRLVWVGGKFSEAAGQLAGRIRTQPQVGVLFPSGCAFPANQNPKKGNALPPSCCVLVTPLPPPARTYCPRNGHKKDRALFTYAEDWHKAFTLDA